MTIWKLRDSETSARQYALKLIRYRGRSEKELTDRLIQKGFSNSNIVVTIDRLKDSGLVDDSSLAASLDEIAKNVKLLGNRGTIYFLKKRGISDGIISQIRSDEDDEVKRAKKFVSKKSRTLSAYTPVERAKKIRGMLLRRGYSHDTVREIVKALREGEDTR